MKKIIPLVLVIAILAGVGYFFLANNLAMTTLISQNKTKIANTYNKAFKSLNSKTAYEYVIKEEEYKAGKIETTCTKEIEIIYTDDVITKMLILVTSQTEEKEYYYEVVEGVATTYITTTPITAEGDEATPMYNKDTTYTPDQILDDLAGAKPTLFQVGDVATKTTLQLLKSFEDTTKEQHATTKSSIVFSFSPFYIGARFTNKSTVEGVENTFEACIDVNGKLKSSSQKTGTASDYTRKTTTFKKYNKSVKIYWRNHKLFSTTQP